MPLTLRFYYPHDIDLIALSRRYGDRFPNIVRRCIQSCIMCDNYRLVIPKNIVNYAGIVTGTIQVSIRLNDDTDKEIIAYLSGLHSRSKNGVIRSMIRSRYDHFPYYMFSQEKSPETIIENIRRMNVTEEPQYENEPLIEHKADFQGTQSDAQLLEQKERVVDAENQMEEPHAKERQILKPTYASDVPIRKEPEEKPKKKKQESGVDKKSLFKAMNALMS